MLSPAGWDAKTSASQFAILKAAACESDTPALPRQETHHVLVQKAVDLIAIEEKTVGGQLGRPSGARYVEGVGRTMHSRPQLAA